MLIRAAGACAISRNHGCAAKTDLVEGSGSSDHLVPMFSRLLRDRREFSFEALELN